MCIIYFLVRQKLRRKNVPIVALPYKFVKFFRNEDVINSGSVICRSKKKLKLTTFY